MNKFLNLKMYTKGANFRRFLHGFFLRPILKILLKINVRDFSSEKYLSEKRPIIIVANHSSHLDIMLIFASLNKKFSAKIATGAAKDYFFTGGLKQKIVRGFFNIFPIERGKNSCKNNKKLFREKSQNQKKNLANLAENKKDERENVLRGLNKKIVHARIPLLIFPEGTRSLDGKIGEFHTGIFRTAINEEAAILPIAISGAHEVLPKGKNFAQVKFRGQISLIIGDLIIAKKNDSPEKLATKTREIIRKNLKKS